MVSVVVAARDEERHLGACLRSIRGQRGVPFECVVVDDGSVDGTTARVRALAADDARFTMIRHDEARGLAAARNAGLAKAGADLVTFVDGDDFLFPGALRSRCDRMGSAPADVVGCYGDWVSVPEWLPALPVRRRAAARPAIWLATADRSVPFIASAPVLRTDLVTRLGGFDETLTTAEDADFWQWWLRLAGRTIYQPTLCVGYRRRAGSMTRRDLTGHHRANTEAFRSFDRALDGAPPGVLPQPEAVYRSENAALSRAGLAAAVALSEGRDDEAAEVLADLDPVVLRLVDPAETAAGATALAKRRLRGTSGGRAAISELVRTAPRLASMFADAAAGGMTVADLGAAADWLRRQRR